MIDVIRISCFILLFLLFGCSSSGKDALPIEIQQLQNLKIFPVDSTFDNTIYFQKSAVYRGENDVLIGRVGSVVVDSLNRVFIADLQEKKVNVFESDGRFVKQIGREGRGPGEFGYIKSLQIRDHRLYGFDSKQNTLNIFELENLTIDKSLVLAQNKIKYPELKGLLPQIDELFVTNNERYIAKFKSDNSSKAKAWENFEFKGLLFPLGNNGEISSGKLFDFHFATGTQVGTSLSNALKGYHLKAFFGNTLIVLSSDEEIYFAEPDHFLIKKYNLKGEYQSAFYYNYSKIPIDQESAMQANLPDLYFNNWESIKAPENWPTFTDLKIDDQDRLWVAVTVEDMKVYEWWVINKEGEVFTKFEWSRNKPIQHIRDGHLYTKEIDEEGLDVVVKYKFVLVMKSK